MTAQPFRETAAPVEDCLAGEDVANSQATGHLFLTCMGAFNEIVGDLATDEVRAPWNLPGPWTRGLTVRDDLGRVLVTSTVNPADPDEYGYSIIELDLDTGEVIAVHPNLDADAEGPSGPVEILFVPHAEPPLAYVTNTVQGDHWIAE